MLALRTCAILALTLSLSAGQKTDFSDFDYPDYPEEDFPEEDFVQLPLEWWKVKEEDPFASLLEEFAADLPTFRPRPRPQKPASASASASASAGAGGAAASGGAAFPSASSGGRFPPPGTSGRPASAPSRRPAATASAGDTLANSINGGSSGGFGNSINSGHFDVSGGGSFRRPGQASGGGSFRRPGQASGGGSFRRPGKPSGGGSAIIFPDNIPADVEMLRRCVCMPLALCPTGRRGRSLGSCGVGQVCCARFITNSNAGGYQPKCGRMIPQPRQLGVRDSSAPWAAALLEAVPNGYIFVCGGTLIHQQVVLTAARCVDKLGERRKNMVVRLGERDLLNDSEIPAHVELQVKDFLVHQNYSSQERYNDLALLFLAEPVTLSPHIDTICVKPETSGQGGCSIDSYGIQSAGNPNSAFNLRLRRADQTPISFRTCEGILRQSSKGPRFNLHPSFTCTRSDLTCDLGEDRAGSPLTCADPELGEHQLHGVVAWGVGCGAEQKPGVYTSVAKFYSWVDYHVTDYFGYIESYFGFNQV